MKKFLTCESGATAIEYSLIAALIAIAMLVSLTLVGSKSATQYNNVANKVSNAMKGK